MLMLNRTYKDYDGNERNEDFYFFLSKAELTEMKFSKEGGFENYIQKIIQEKNQAKMIETMKELVRKAYGEKSLDGRTFVKNEEVLNRFVQTEAYSDLFMELATNDEFAAKFVNGIMPTDLAEAVAKQNAGSK